MIVDLSNDEREALSTMVDERLEWLTAGLHFGATQQDIAEIAEFWTDLMEKLGNREQAEHWRTHYIGPLVNEH